VRLCGCGCGEEVIKFNGHEKLYVDRKHKNRAYDRRRYVTVPHLIIKCKDCGNSFRAINKLHKYCSKTCKRGKWLASWHRREVHRKEQNKKRYVCGGDRRRNRRYMKRKYVKRTLRREGYILSPLWTPYINLRINQLFLQRKIKGVVNAKANC